MIETKNGFLIIFEGLDGSGKTTQCQLLKEKLKNDGHNVVLSKEPTDGKYGTILRKSFDYKRNSAEWELEQMILDRKQHIKDLIKPSLDENKIVIIDRYVFSNMAYQGAAGINPNLILKKNDFAIKPNLTILIDAPVKMCLERLKQRNQHINQMEKEKNLLKVQEIYLNYDFPNKIVFENDSIENLSSKIYNHVVSILKVK